MVTRRDSRNAQVRLFHQPHKIGTAAPSLPSLHLRTPRTNFNPLSEEGALHTVEGGADESCCALLDLHFPVPWRFEDGKADVHRFPQKPGHRPQSARRLNGAGRTGEGCRFGASGWFKNVEFLMNHPPSIWIEPPIHDFIWAVYCSRSRHYGCSL